MLNKIQLDSFAEVYDILEKSFPKDERRSFDGQKKLFEKTEYGIYAEKPEDNIIGFIAVWEFGDFAYIEHFAVKEGHRNGGRGGSMLREILDTIRKPFVLEVEPPTEEEAKRRIDFYRRSGFFLNEYHYIQQPLEEGRDPVELKIMSYPEELNREGFDRVKERLYKCVFGVE